MKADFYNKNRKKLREKVKPELIVVSGNDEMQRRADAAYPFVQESNFYYLTGINEASWKLAFVKDREILIAPSRSDVQTLFDGGLSHEAAHEISGIKEVIDSKTWKNMLEGLRNDYKTVATIAGHPHQKSFGFSLNTGPDRLLRVLRRHFDSVEDIRPVLESMRSIKQPEEIEAIREAIAVTIESFKFVRLDLANYKYESDIAARLTFDFMSKRSGGHAYDPIVAVGKNACTLHYSNNNDTLVDGQLLLIDAGAAYSEYAADITRTYAIGDLSDRKKAVHAAVEAAHYKIIDLIKPGVSLEQYSKSVDEIMKDELEKLGLLKKPSDYRRYFPHAISHGLGLDVHDSLGGHKEFMPGMVLTVEPGIYIPDEGIGVRIEDDILVTEQGNENLSAELPTSL